jgi:predicted metal-dependent peptidase
MNETNEFYNDVLLNAYKYHNVNTDDIKVFKEEHKDLHEEIIEEIIKFSSRLVLKAEYTVGNLLSNFYIELCDSSVTTTILLNGYGSNIKRFSLVINFNYWLSLGKIKKAFFKKEALITDKMTSFFLLHLLDAENKQRDVYGLACDLETNQYLSNNMLSELDGYSLDEINKITQLDLPPDKTALEYYALLKEELDEQTSSKISNNQNDETEEDETEENNSSQKSGITLKDILAKSKYNSNHFKDFGEGITKEEIQDNIAKTLQEMQNIVESMEDGSKDKMWGNMSSKIEHLLDALNVPKPQVNYRTMLRKFVGGARGGYKLTLSKPSRSQRFGSRGRRRSKGLPHILIAIDESGSMSNKDIILCLTEISTINAQFTLAQFDTAIVHKELFSKRTFTQLLKRGYVRRSTGGTDFNCIMKEFGSNIYSKNNLNGYSCVIIFTDGYALSAIPTTKDNVKIHNAVNKVRWILSASGSDANIKKDYSADYIWKLENILLNLKNK